MAFKGKRLNSSSHPSAENRLLTLWQLLELQRQVGVHYEENRNLYLQGASFTLKAAWSSPFPHGVGKRDANLPSPQNSNIAQFNSFSTLVELKKKIKQKSKINRIFGDKTQLLL